MRTRLIAFLVAAAAVAAPACSKKNQSSPPPEPPAEKPADKPRRERPKLVRSQPLPKLARDVLHDRMTEHGDDMESLLWTVLMLDYESAATIADRIGKTDKLSRPEPSDNTTLNAALPDRFFDYQDELYDAANALRDAARAKDDAAISEQFNRISRACLGCHSLYLKLGPVPEQ